ncbi:Uncaracterized surface protein containing fasciclin (FAS1) repeats [Parapedobacter composti]|uniref:Uncaracterized surface protein containing fasciclin (FAS1) repeats n=1 Tax=Parapedobacter composti TaxID=623281 RepID=A0A1I1E1J3_9SPHI|nr:fasciclin domain-containing protein [Parapedobacter composti]SFB80937.1 Uncaracterized surface protein containing fasciclin (FAS1) repeats [Parapedobacter composti]
MKSIQHLLWGLFALTVLVQSCEDPWSKHIAVNDEALAGNLLDNLKKNPQLSRFAQLLQQTGYDKVIASSKSYTVWAPVNAAIDALDPDLLADEAYVKKLVEFHLADQAYFANKIPQDSTVRLPTLGGKALNMTANHVDGVIPVDKDIYGANGVLHVLPVCLTPKPNAWEQLQAVDGHGSQLKTFLESLYALQFDVEQSTQIGVNPDGLPVYDSVFTLQNVFLNQVANLEDEMGEYTFFVVSDEVFQREQQRLSRFFVDSTAELSVYHARWNAVKDLVIAGNVPVGALNAPQYSLVDSVLIQVKPANVIASYAVSNGTVHLVNDYPYAFETKIKPIIVEGEAPEEVRDGRGFSVRTRLNPDGQVFYDLLIQNHGVNGMWVRYFPRLYSGRYRVYWRVIRDADLGLVPAADAEDLVHFPMKVTWGEDPLTAPGTDGFGYRPAPVINNGNGTFSPDYSEHLLGELTVDRYGLFSLYLVGNTTTANGTNTLLLDYLRLEPIY